MSLADTHLRRVLAAMAGPAARPREDQTAAVAALVEQQARVLVVQATGWGKSAVYWAATSALRASGRGPTLIVSPLLALMRDQVDAAATQAGLRAATVNSTNLGRLERRSSTTSPPTAWTCCWCRPNGWATPASRSACPACWPAHGAGGHRRGALHLGLGLRLPARLPAPGQDAARPSATTRRCWPPPPPPTPASRSTSLRQLGPDRRSTCRGSLARSSLHLSVVPGLGALERYAWVADALDRWPARASSTPLDGGRDRAAGRVPAVVRGIEVAAYHGQPPTPTRGRPSRTNLRATR